MFLVHRARFCHSHLSRINTLPRTSQISSHRAAFSGNSRFSSGVFQNSFFVLWTYNAIVLWSPVGVLEKPGSVSFLRPFLTIQHCCGILLGLTLTHASRFQTWNTNSAQLYLQVLALSKRFRTLKRERDGSNARLRFVASALIRSETGERGK